MIVGFHASGTDTAWLRPRPSGRAVQFQVYGGCHPSGNSQGVDYSRALGPDAG